MHARSIQLTLKVFLLHVHSSVLECTILTQPKDTYIYMLMYTCIRGLRFLIQKKNILNIYVCIYIKNQYELLLISVLNLSTDFDEIFMVYYCGHLDGTSLAWCTFLTCHIKYMQSLILNLLGYLNLFISSKNDDRTSNS